MGMFEKYVARNFFFWMVRFLRTKYENVEIVFIAHHTEAHCDLFKNNVRFSNTRDIVESMAASAERIRSYESGSSKPIKNAYFQ